MKFWKRIEWLEDDYRRDHARLVDLQCEADQLRKRVDALEARIGQYGDDHVLGEVITWSMDMPRATIRNCQPYGDNVDAMGHHLHRECMEGIV